VAADEGEFGTVGRPSEAVADVLGSEIGYLLSGGTVERLEPEVVDVMVADGIDDGFAIGTEADRSRRRTLEIEKLGGLLGVEGGKG
jgi:hypothetical protein